MRLLILFITIFFNSLLVAQEVEFPTKSPLGEFLQLDSVISEEPMIQDNLNSLEQEDSKDEEKMEEVERETKREEVKFSETLLNPMGFTRKSVEIGDTPDLWSRAVLLKEKGKKRSDFEDLQITSFRYICFKAQLERKEQLEVSQSSLNKQFCEKITDGESSDALTLKGLRNKIIADTHALDSSEAISFIRDLAKVYSEAFVLRFPQDPQFLMQLSSELLFDIYDQDPLLFEGRKQAQDKNWIDHSFSAGEAALTGYIGFVGSRMINRVLFGEVLRGGIKTGVQARVAAKIRSGWEFFKKRPHKYTFESRVVNGKKKIKVLVWENAALNEPRSKCAKLFSRFATFTKLAVHGLWWKFGVWDGFGSSNGLGKIFEEYKLASDGILAHSHPLDSVSRVQRDTMEEVYDQLEEQREFFINAKNAINESSEEDNKWLEMMEEAIVHKKQYYGTVERKPEMSEQDYILLVKESISEEDREEMKKELLNSAVVWNSTAEGSPYAKTKSIINFLSSSAAQTGEFQIKRIQANKQAGVEEQIKVAPAVNKARIAGAIELLNGSASQPSMSRLAQEFVGAYTEKYGF